MGAVALVFNAMRIRAECCVDPLTPPDLPGKWMKTGEYKRVITNPNKMQSEKSSIPLTLTCL